MGGLRCDPVTAYPECGGTTVRPGDCLPRVWGDYGVTRGLLTQSAGGLRCDPGTAYPECGGTTVRPGDCLPRVGGDYGVTRGLLAYPECGGTTVRPGDCLPRVWGGGGGGATARMKIMLASWTDMFQANDFLA